MRKLADLRQHVIASVPNLKRNPDKLLTFIEDGNVRFHCGTNLNHEYQVPVRLIVTDYRGELDDIVIPVLDWLRVREPGFNPRTAVSLEAEILSNDSYDISLTVNITEHVIVSVVEGKRVIEHVLPDPPLEMDPGAAWEVIPDLQGAQEDVANDG